MYCLESAWSGDWHVDFSNVSIIWEYAVVLLNSQIKNHSSRLQGLWGGSLMQSWDVRFQRSPTADWQLSSYVV